ncbi:hypothetical protein CDO52_00175 [Nocardiopsis gilva YIM 90087]|uniref:Uncharacterized protein n=1 Tax=Nocardiopsis gilva YIM 90087 TaxID=1235441 RepID=A0A223RZX0_9ACTN|nr:hypothetical protein [Nocardiopsis gilva]ASU81404.1 hypothetical protein CDO52_00175 [Nocardiopsis gilva YIM 90087]
MPGIDLSHLETPVLEPFVVTLPQPAGEIRLRPITALPAEGHAALLRITAALADLDQDDQRSVMAAMADALPDLDALLRAACPSKTVANQLMTVLNAHLEEKIRVALGYIGQDQAGEASPSAS